MTTNENDLHMKKKKFNIQYKTLFCAFFFHFVHLNFTKLLPLSDTLMDKCIIITTTCLSKCVCGEKNKEEKANVNVT